jgi:hypothetical protein
MIIHYYTNSQHELFNSVERYFHFILNYKLSPIDRQSPGVKRNSRLLVWSEEKEQPEFLNIVNTRQQKSVITLGVDETFAINLLHLDKLNLSLTNILNIPDGQHQPPFTREELLLKAQSFFKSHGEESLLSSLNWTIYYISNGPVLFKNGECTWNEYQTNYLNPGVANWKAFKEKLAKYGIYLDFLGYSNTLDKVRKIAYNFQDFLSELIKGSSSASHQIDYKNLEVYINGLRTIDSMLLNIANELKISG